MSKAYVLLSGGMDSTTCLAIAAKAYGPQNVTAISIFYGQRHAKELEAARVIAELFEVEWRMIDLGGAIGVGGLTDTNLVMPESSYAELPEGISPTYVPFRNGLMLSSLASIAQADESARFIYYGAHAEDAENDAYPDCSVPFIQAMKKAINIGTYRQITLKAPLMKLTKAEVVRWGDDLGVPWEVTWSCYKGELLHCGTCPTCISRREAFAAMSIFDPTRYAS